MKAQTDDKEQVKEILYRWEQLQQNRSQFIDRWTEVQRYVSPTVYNWDDPQAIPTIPQRYSSEPCNYLSVLVSGITGYSISPNLTWFRLGLEEEEALSKYGVKKWLEEVENVLFAEFNRSNLYKQAVTWVRDAATIGHGVMLCDEDLKKNRLRFTAMKSNEVFLDTDEYGEVDTIYRSYIMTLKNAVEFFGEDNLDTTLRENYKEVKHWNDPIELLMAVYPRKEYDEEKQDALNMKYACVYIDVVRKKKILESGYKENPFAVFEWDQIAGLAYSNSPSMNAMPDIKALNIVRKTSLQICQTSAEPPMKVSTSIRNVNIIPRGFTYVNGPDEVIEPIRTGDNYPITINMVEDLQQNVKEWFNVDFFLMLQQKQGQMTATEVMELQGEKSAVLSNLVVSLNEALTRIISRSFNLLARAGKIPEAPEALQDFKTGIKIDFIGPLAQAQKKYHTSGGLAQALQLVAPIMQLFPDTRDYINSDELIKRAMEGQGMPQSIIAEDKDVEKIRDDRAKAQAQAIAEQKQMQGMETLVNNANKLNEPIQQGSVLAGMNEALSGGMQNG